MALDIVPLEPIERGQLHVMRIRALAFLAMLMAPAVIVPYLAVPLLFEEWGVPLWAPVAAVLAIGLYAMYSAGRRWRRWGYAFTGREFHVAQGWLVQVHTIVPVARVQHIDVVQGAMQRLFGVSTLVLHTAGTDASVVGVPGVTRETAEAIRDAIRVKIGSVTGSSGA